MRSFAAPSVTFWQNGVYVMPINRKLRELLEDHYRRREELKLAMQDNEDVIRLLEAAAERPSSRTEPTLATTVQGRPGAKAAEWACRVLRETGNDYMHYRAITEKVVRLGYKGQLRPVEIAGSEQHVKRLAKSFRGTLNREKDIFEGSGDGNFRLRNLESSGGA